MKPEVKVIYNSTKRKLLSCENSHPDLYKTLGASDIFITQSIIDKDNSIYRCFIIATVKNADKYSNQPTFDEDIYNLCSASIILKNIPGGVLGKPKLDNTGIYSLYRNIILVGNHMSAIIVYIIEYESISCELVYSSKREFVYIVTTDETCREPLSVKRCNEYMRKHYSTIYRYHAFIINHNKVIVYAML